MSDNNVENEVGKLLNNDQDKQSDKTFTKQLDTKKRTASTRNGTTTPSRHYTERLFALIEQEVQEIDTERKNFKTEIETQGNISTQ